MLVKEIPNVKIDINSMHDMQHTWICLICHVYFVDCWDSLQQICTVMSRMPDICQAKEKWFCKHCINIRLFEDNSSAKGSANYLPPQTICRDLWHSGNDCIRGKQSSWSECIGGIQRWTLIEGFRIVAQTSMTHMECGWRDTLASKMHHYSDIESVIAKSFICH